MKNRENNPHHDHSFNQITEFVYLGYNMKCCTQHFTTLKKLGIVADINVEKENKEDPHELEVHMWLPTPEHKIPSPLQLKVGANAIKSLSDSKKKVYVHCEKGHARSVVIVGAYLVLTGMTAEAALDFIKEKRKVAHPGPEHLAALKNFTKTI